MSKEEIKTNEQAEKIVDRFLASSLVATIILVAKTIRTILIIVVPFALATYILHTQADRLVLGLGVAIAIVGGINLLKTAYNLEKLSTKSKRR